METFVSRDFLNHLDELWYSIKDDILSPNITNMQAMVHLLLALPVKTDLIREEVEQVITEKNGQTTVKSIRDLIISLNVRNNTQFSIGADLSVVKNFSAYYLLNNESDWENELGVVVKDTGFDGSSFYDECTVADIALPENSSWECALQYFAPCNSMLIIDKYIFSNPFETKLKSLLEFINLHKKNIKVPFHLTIIFSTEFKNTKQPPLSTNHINKAFHELKSMKSIDCELVIDNRIAIDDRLVFTNYTSANIGHPFDGRPTRFNQNFLGFETDKEKIRRNYKQYLADLRYWKKVIDKIPNNVGLQQVKWKSTNFENRIFNILS